MKLTTRLLALVGVAVLPALAITVYTEIDLRRMREAEVRASAERMSIQAAAEVRRAVESVQRFGVTLAQVPAIREATRDPNAAEGCLDLLVRLRREYPGRVEVAVADGQGRIVCTSQGVRSFRPVTGQHFRRAMDTNAFVVGGYGESTATGTRYLTFAQPVRDESGQPTGALLLGLETGALAAEMSDRIRGLNAQVSVADRDFIYLIRLPERPDRIGTVGKSAPGEARALAQFADKGLTEVTPSDGVTRFIHITSLSVSRDASSDRPDLLVGFGLSRQAAFAAIDGASLRGAVLLLAGLGLVALAAQFAGRRFVREPIRQLLAAARSWSAGDYGARVRLDDRGEFGELGAALDRMAEETERRDRALRESQRALLARSGELEGVLATVPAAVWFTYDPSVKRVVRNRYAAELMRVDPQSDAAFGSAARDILSHIRVLRGHGAVAPQDMPLQRAMRGEVVADEEYVFAYDDGTERTLLSSASPLLSETGERLGAVAVSLDISDRKTAERQQQLLIHELNHRVKNTLATVQSLALHTFRADSGMQNSRSDFEARLMALARAHDVLTRENWEGASLGAVVAEATGPYASSERDTFRIEGPPVMLSPRLALAISMALHEMCTNAAKYGALSVPAGQVLVDWKIVPGEDGSRLRLRWDERNGPPVAPPTRKGFGSRLIERQVAQELGGRALIDYAEAGVVCSIEVPLPAEPGEPHLATARA